MFSHGFCPGITKIGNDPKIRQFSVVVLICVVYFSFKKMFCIHYSDECCHSNLTFDNI